MSNSDNETKQDTALAEVERIQKAIVKALEDGRDTAPLLAGLAAARAKIASRIELETLQKAASHRAELKSKVDDVKSKVASQRAAIDSFLAARDAVVAALTPVVQQAEGLVPLQSECHAHDNLAYPLPPGHQLPGCYFPKDFTLPRLQLGDGTQPKASESLSLEATTYLKWALGILSAITVTHRQFVFRPAVGLEADSPAVVDRCSVCNHPGLESINADLKGGVPLRELAATYGLSKSAVERHKGHVGAR